MSINSIPLWVGAVVPVLILGLALADYLRRYHRQLAFSVTEQEGSSRSPFPWLRLGLVTDDGRPLSRPRFVEFILRNSGRVEVHQNDDWERLRVRVAGAELVQFSIVRSPDLEVDVQALPGGGFEIRPLSLNPGELLVVRAILDGGTSRPVADIRIVGYKVVDESRQESIEEAFERAVRRAGPTGIRRWLGRGGRGGERLVEDGPVAPSGGRPDEAVGS